MRKGEGRKGSTPDAVKPQQLNAKQSAFVDEYLVDLNATQAAIRVGYSEKTAAQIGSRLLTKVEVQQAVAERRLILQETTKVTPEKVLSYWWELATADPAELSAVQRRCCRHCYGNDHLHQWIDGEEYERAVANALREDMTPPDDDGGYGFDPKLTPHAKCPKCFGEGHAHVHLADTRELSPAGRLLFDGVRETKFGIEVKVQDRSKALENVAKHLGMFKIDVNHGLQADSPLAELFSSLAGKTLKPEVDSE